MMKSSVYVLVLIVFVLCGCTKVHKTNDVSTDIVENGSMLKQQFIDSLLSTVEWENHQSHIEYLGLNGHISKIDYSIKGDGFYLPFETINFDEDGRLISVFSGDYVYNCILEDNREEKILRLGVDGVGLGMEFNMVRKDHKSIFEGYDEMGSAQYTFSRDSNNEISNLVILYKFYPDIASDECEESRQTFKVKVNSSDGKGNWISLTFSSKDNSTTINRNITYIEAPTCIKYFESKFGDKVLCKFPSQYDTFYLRLYDCTTKKWRTLLPPPYEREMFGYNDFRLIDNRLYLIYNTGNNWIDAVCGIYIYDIKHNTWKELDMCGEECAFEGNRIKVPHYKVVKEGDCTANNEYEESIEWIELE